MPEMDESRPTAAAREAAKAWFAREDQVQKLVGAGELAQVVVTHQHAVLHAAGRGPDGLVLNFDNPDVSWTRAELDERWAILVQVALHVEVSDSEDEDETPLFEGRATVGAAVTFPAGMEAEDEAITSYAERTVTLSAFPYLRATIHRLMSDAGLPPITLPFLRSRAGLPASFWDIEPSDEEQ